MIVQLYVLGPTVPVVSVVVISIHPHMTTVPGTLMKQKYLNHKRYHESHVHREKPMELAQTCVQTN